MKNLYAAFLCTFILFFARSRALLEVCLLLPGIPLVVTRLFVIIPPLLRLRLSPRRRYWRLYISMAGQLNICNSRFCQHSGCNRPGIFTGRTCRQPLVYKDRYFRRIRGYFTGSCYYGYTCHNGGIQYHYCGSNHLL